VPVNIVSIVVETGLMWRPTLHELPDRPATRSAERRAPVVGDVGLMNRAAGISCRMLQTDVAPGVHRVEDAYANWYLVEGDDGLLAVDAGVPASWRSLMAALAQLGRTPGDLRALLLTHAHFDHIGFAERARSELGIEVWVHENDVPLTHHPLQYAHERSVLGYLLRHRQARPIAIAFARSRAFFPQPVTDVRRYGDDGELPLPGRPRVCFTPGHTLGHCALHLADRDVLIAGDALVTLNPYTGGRGPQIVARAATADSTRALASLDALAATGAQIVLPGHGEPWKEGIERAVEQARATGAT
jgi:glyoxylase-like metal-dependent hydrolase (beta-lactamase superfamily II)